MEVEAVKGKIGERFVGENGRNCEEDGDVERERERGRAALVEAIR